MATLLITGLSLVGLYLNNIDKEKEKKNLKKDIEKNENSQGRNIYDTRKLKKINRDVDKKASELWDKSKNPKETNIIPYYYNKLDKTEKEKKEIIEKYGNNNEEKVTVSDIFTNHMSLFEKSNQIINDFQTQQGSGSYVEQFESMSYDNKDPALAENLIIDRSLKEGFSSLNNKDMTYDIVSGDNFKHNNMVPFFSSKSYGNFNDSWDNIKQNKVDLFSGSSRNYVPKQERKPLFNPIKDLTHTHGMPNNTEYRHNRYGASVGRERRNETLLQPQRVAPGVNQGYNAIGIDGVHPSYRALPKTVDELRVANRPQISYSTPAKSGFRREMRPIQAEVNKYKPETYRNELRRNMVPNLGNIRGPKVRDNVFTKTTNRETTLKEHYGGAGNSETSVGKNVPIEMIPKVKKTDKNVYNNPGVSNLSNSNRWDEKHHNRIQQSYFIPENERSYTQFNQHLLGPQRSKGSVAYDPKMFRAKATIRELTEHNQHITNANKSMGSIAYDPNAIAKPTIRELTECSQHITNATRSKASVAYDPKDIAKKTIKELTENNQHITNASRSKGSVAFDPNAIAKPTTRELTEHMQHISNVGRNKASIAYDPYDIAKHTIKELTEHNQHITNANRNMGSVAYDPNSIAKSTIRELTENNQHITNVNRTKASIAYDPNDIAKHTMKEITEHNQHITNANRNMGSIAYDPNDVAKYTTRQLTEHNQHITNATRSKGTIAYDPNDTARNTIKETTEHNQHITNAGKNNGSIAYDPNDTARNTIKQLTDHNQHILGPGHNRANIVYDPNDTARNTIKQLTDHNQHILGPGHNRANIAYDPNDIARNTIKQLTDHNQHILGPNRDKGNITYDPEKWKLRPTNRQTTQNTFYIPAGFSYDHQAPRVYDAEYNATIDDCKEVVAMSGRKPTNSNYTKGPIPDKETYTLKEEFNIERDNIPDCRNLNALYRFPEVITKSRMTVPQEERRLDENILNGLDTNPFSIPNYFDSCDPTLLK